MRPDVYVHQLLRKRPVDDRFLSRHPDSRDELIELHANEHESLITDKLPLLAYIRVHYVADDLPCNVIVLRFKRAF